MNSKVKEKIYRKEYRLKNKEKIKQQKKNFYLKNKEKIKEKQRKKYYENKIQKLLYQKEYYKKNKKRINNYNKKLRLNNLEKYQENDKKYYYSNYETKIKLKKREYMRKKRKNPIFKIVESIKRRTLLALKNKNSKKYTKHMTLVGCSPLFLKNYLELKFKNGMSWENHGMKGWHIDHIIPCSSFNLKDPEEQKKCFHYTNLQPLWWYENLKKSNKIF